MNDDHEHMMPCRDCGQMIDRRDLGQVFEHEHRGLEAPQGSRGVRVDDMISTEEN